MNPDKPETGILTATGTYVNRDGKWYRVSHGTVDLSAEVTPEEVFGPETLLYLVTKPPPKD